jgi:hypothetical protein
MGFLGGFDDLLYEPGEGYGGFVRESVSKAADFACQLYHDHPGMVNPFDPFGFGRGTWDAMCKPRSPGLPPPPPPPAFPGGQCGGVLYGVRIRFTGSNGVVEYAEDYNLYGEISGNCTTLQTATYSNRETGWKAEISTHGRQSVGGYSTVLTDWRIPAGGTGVRFAPDTTVVASVDAVWRMDGQPDNCGNLPSGYPPVILPEGDRTTIINVNHDDGTSVAIPVVINMPVANVDFDLNMPLTINLGGLHFHVDADGFHSGKPKKDNSKDIKDIKDKLDDATDPPNPENDPRLTPTVQPAADSDEEQDMDSPRWLKVHLTRLPDKAQYSRNGRSVYFAGWLEFLKGDFALPRIQINYQKSIFRFPDGADGYSYTFTNGASGTVTVYTEEEQEEEGDG